MNACLNDWKIRTSQLPVRLILLTLSTILAAMTCTNTRAAEPEYNNWYQVEIIIFALESPPATDENWPLKSLTYPANMIGVAPYDNTQRSPYTMRQLEQVLAHDQLLPDADSIPEDVEPTTSYLFESRSRFKVPVPDKGLDADPVDENLVPAETPDNEPEDTDSTVESVLDLEALFVDEKPQAFRTVARKARDLNGLARSINRSSLYRLILHQAWRQPLSSEDQANPVLIQAGKHYDDVYEIDGTIAVSRARYLHVATDLWYTEFTSRFGQQPLPMTLDVSPQIAKKYPQVIAWESQRGNYLPIHSHILKQSRRMRSSTLHYLDHPYFGLLVRVKGYDPES